MLDLPPGKWTGLESLSAEVLEAEMRPAAARSIRDAALYFSNEIKRTLSGQRHGRTYLVGKTGRMHVASAPGEPPAVLFGNLRNSVGFSEPAWEGNTVSAEVGVGLGAAPAGGEPDPASTYARRLEFGGVDSRGIRILPRPYLEPTRLRVEPVIERMLAQGVGGEP